VLPDTGGELMGSQSLSFLTGSRYTMKETELFYLSLCVGGLSTIAFCVVRKPVYWLMALAAVRMV